MIINSLSHYEKHIQSNYVIDDCGIDLNSIGYKQFEKEIPVNLKATDLVDLNNLRVELKFVIDFINSLHSKPIWHKINVIDQAVNDYVGIGYLNYETDWLSFIIDYLNKDRAEESGATIIVLFDLYFNWAVSFVLSQDNSVLIVSGFNLS